MKKIEVKSIISININKEIKKFIIDINDLIDKHIPLSNKYSQNNFIKKLFLCQQDINQKLKKKEIFNLLNKELKKNFHTKKYAVSDFILRYVQKNNKKLKPIILHQEKLYGDKSWDKIYNLWIPIRNNNKKNSIKYIKRSNRFIEGKDFEIKERLTIIKKKTYGHKLGSLYKEKRLFFLRKVKKDILYFKNSLIIFHGNLIHGAGINTSNLPRISLDLRFMRKRDLKINNKSSSTNKKYFSDISIS